MHASPLHMQTYAAPQLAEMGWLMVGNEMYWVPVGPGSPPAAAVAPPPTPSPPGTASPGRHSSAATSVAVMAPETNNAHNLAPAATAPAVPAVRSPVAPAATVPAASVVQPPPLPPISTGRACPPSGACSAPATPPSARSRASPCTAAHDTARVQGQCQQHGAQPPDYIQAERSSAHKVGHELQHELAVPLSQLTNKQRRRLKAAAKARLPCLAAVRRDEALTCRQQAAIEGLVCGFQGVAHDDEAMLKWKGVCEPSTPRGRRSGPSSPPSPWAQQ